MNDELQQKIMSLIDGAETVIPEVAQEYLAWGVATSTILIIAGALMLILGSILLYKGLTTKDGSFMYKNDLEGLFIGIGAFLLLIGIVMTIDGTVKVIKIKTAPKVYLIDALRSK